MKTFELSNSSGARRTVLEHFIRSSLFQWSDYSANLDVSTITDRGHVWDPGELVEKQTVLFRSPDRGKG